MNNRDGSNSPTSSTSNRGSGHWSNPGSTSSRSTSGTSESRYPKIETVVAEAYREEKQASFLLFVADIKKLTFSDNDNYLSKQNEIASKYFETYVGDTKEAIRKQSHFTFLYKALQGESLLRDLPRDEKMAFFAIVKNCLNKELIEKVIKTISIEKEKSVEDILSSYIDSENRNILHCLAGLIANKEASSLPITQKDLEAFYHFAKLVPALMEQKDSWGYKPNQIRETFKTKRKDFVVFIDAIDELELSGAINYSRKQIDELDDYLNTCNQEIRANRHFTLLDMAIQGHFPSSGLYQNEGTAFFQIVRRCLNKELIEKVIQIIHDEKGKNVINTYIESESKYNILHCLADLIVEKEANGLPITKKDWEAYSYFTEIAPNLTKQKDFVGRTPDEIITQRSNLELHQGRSFIIPSFE